MMSSVSRYGFLVHAAPAASVTRVPLAVQARVEEWPRLRLWPSSWPRTPVVLYPLLQRTPPLERSEPTVPRPAMPPQSVRALK